MAEPREKELTRTNYFWIGIAIGINIGFVLMFIMKAI